MAHIVIAIAALMASLYVFFVIGCTALAAILPDEQEEERMWARMKQTRPWLWRWLGWMR